MPEKYGGMGLGAMEHAILVEEFSRVDASMGGAQNLVQQAAMALHTYGTEEQKQQYLPAVIEGRKFCITGITEARAGSKLTDMETRAERRDGSWVLNGAKSEVHAPEHVRLCLILAMTPGGVSAFLVDTSDPGFHIGRRRYAIGMRGMPMAEIEFRDIVLPTERLLGEEGGGYDVFFKSFELTRIGNAAKAIGIARGALERALGYARERRVGRNVVTDFQGIRWQIAQFASRIEACRLLMHAAAQEYDRTGRSELMSLQAKLLACELAMEVTTAAVQWTGSHGCFEDQPFSMYMLDAKVGQVTGGTLEIARNSIARLLLGKETSLT